MSHFQPIAAGRGELAAVNTLFFSGDFGEDRTQKKEDKRASPSKRPQGSVRYVQSSPLDEL
jgi:hypothetical protein